MMFVMYGPNHPQLKWHTCVTRVCRACQMHGILVLYLHTCMYLECRDGQLTGLAY